MAGYESVDRRDSIQEIGANRTENLLQQRFLVHSRKGREIEIKASFIR